MNTGLSAPAMKAFVIGPIGDKDAPDGSPARLAYEEGIQVFEDVVAPACTAFGLEAIRADMISRTGEIPEQIFRQLRDCPLVIADLTGARHHWPSNDSDWRERQASVRRCCNPNHHVQAKRSRACASKKGPIEGAGRKSGHWRRSSELRLEQPRPTLAKSPSHRPRMMNQGSLNYWRKWRLATNLWFKL